MVEVGQYQDEIKSLSALNIKDYERIFKLFKMSIDNKDFYTYNILNTVQFPVLDSQYIQYYECQKRMPMTLISYEIYGDIRSWWIIYLLNKDKFDNAPFYVEGGVQLQYISDEFRSQVYSDVTQSTVYSNRHY